MPTWCRYCHQTNHTKFECDKAKARIICYSCNQLGHRSFECPRKNVATQNKKRKMPKRSSPALAPSKEAMRSAYAETSTPTPPPESHSPSHQTTTPTLAGDFMSEDDENDKDYDPMSESDDDSELSHSDIDTDEVNTVSHEEKDPLLSEASKDIDQVLASALKAKKTYIQQIQQLKSRPAGVVLSTTESETLDQLTKELDVVGRSIENITNQEHHGAFPQ
ncbi:hypothetical protein A0J61_10442 [Choanephora cucurbitarum]|uniref:CCHC-type domain-containing protein n=1 Tax=Choanephora cucurbitarum TaxID=101091 RepID=A0A1C7MYN1_9FUNG|nr:hypothetical protein A0J61_10442 [Choanephora cucurbitarum]